MRVQPVNENGSRFWILGMGSYIETRTAEHSVMRFAWVKVWRSHYTPSTSRIRSIVPQPLSKPAAVQDGCNSTGIEGVVPVSIPPHGEIDGTLINQLTPELKYFFSLGVSKVDIPVAIMIIKHFST